MTNTKDKTMENQQRLLSDADFATLMEAEFTRETEPTNEVSKQRIWRNIQATIDKHSFFNLHNQTYAAVATLLVVAIALPLFFLEFTSNSYDVGVDATGIERTKGIDNSINVDLSVFTLGESGKLIRSDGQHEVGTILLFKIRSTQNGVAAVISSRNGNLVNNGFVYKISQNNSGQLISNKSQVYGYMIEPIDKILQFCVIAATDTNRLNDKLNNLAKTWTALPANSCATINVTNSLQ